MCRGCILSVLKRASCGNAHCRNGCFFQDEPGWVMRCRPLGVTGIPDVPWDGRVLRVIYRAPCTVGRLMLRIRLAECIFGSDHDDEYSSKSYSFSDLYDSLREICILDIVGVSIKTEVVLSLSSSSPPQLVRHYCYYEIDDFPYLPRSRFYQIYRVFFLIKPIKQASSVLRASREGTYNTMTDLPTASEPQVNCIFFCNASPNAHASCVVKTYCALSYLHLYTIPPASVSSSYT